MNQMKMNQMKMSMKSSGSKKKSGGMFSAIGNLFGSKSKGSAPVK